MNQLNMNKEIKYLALIPLRGGSKSIPLKNIKKLSDKPLCHWVIEAALACTHIDKVIVATDSEIIKEVVLEIKNPRLIVIGRSEKTSSDIATTESIMLEAANNYHFDNMILIQATSPLLTGGDLDNAINQYEREHCDSLLSIVNQKRFIWKQTKETAIPVNYSPLNRPRRQNFDGLFVENGAFYITKKQGLLSTGSRLNGKIGLYQMPEKTYFEIDEPDDWEVVEKLINKQNKRLERSNLKDKAKKIKLVITDVDGVLTDSGMYYTESGDELKKFNTRDGKGMELLRKRGIILGIITSEDTKIVACRAEKLKVKHLYQGVHDKLKILKKILDIENLKTDEVAYIGDDINDIEVLQRVIMSATPQDGASELKSIVSYICKRKGGEGCFREFTELILGLQAD